MRREGNRNPWRRRGNADAFTPLCTGAEVALCVNPKRIVSGSWVSCSLCNHH
jgi:hypothetical protein